MDNTQKELIELEKNLSYQEGLRDGIVRAIEIGKQIDSLNRLLNAIDTGNPRELGLALGYQDIGVIMGGGKPIAAKSQLTDLWHQARQETPPARAITPPTPVEAIRGRARVGVVPPLEVPPAVGAMTPEVPLVRNVEEEISTIRIKTEKSEE